MASLKIARQGSSTPLIGFSFATSMDCNQLPIAYTIDSWAIGIKLTSYGVSYEMTSCPDKIIVRGEEEIAKLIRLGAYVEGYSKSAEEITEIRERVKDSMLNSAQRWGGILSEHSKAQLEEDFRVLKFLDKYGISGDAVGSLRTR